MADDATEESTEEQIRAEATERLEQLNAGEPVAPGEEDLRSEVRWSDD